MKCRRSSAVATMPSATPPSAMASSCPSEMSSAMPSIQAPGMVNARPPATMAPADMTVWVTLASLSVLRPRLTAFRKNSDTMAANTMGHGRAPMRRAM